MVTKKRTTARRAAPRAYPARRAAPRRRVKSGTQYIPGAMATAALVAVNIDGIKAAYNYANTSSTRGFFQGSLNYLFAQTGGARTARSKLISKDALVKDVIAVAGGYVGGEIVKKYAPGVIKRPLGKIAKKIPKVI